jgi:ABC-type Fe3+ transport system permease subunit
MSTTLLILLSVIEAVLLVLVLAVALTRIRQRLTRISEGLGTLGGALSGVESGHLRPLGPAVIAINRQFEIILSALPGIGAKAAIVAARRQK